MAGKQEGCGLVSLFYYCVAVASFAAMIIVVTTIEPDKKPSEELESFSELRLRCLEQEKSEREELISALENLTLEKFQQRLTEEEELKCLGIVAIICSVALLLLFNCSSVSCSAMDQSNSRLAGQGHLLMMERFRKVRDEAVEEVIREMEGGAQETQDRDVKDEEDEKPASTPSTPAKVMPETREAEHGDPPPVNIANSVVYITTSSAPPSPHRPSQPRHDLQHSW